jgi:hypothetical protein
LPRNTANINLADSSIVLFKDSLSVSTFKLVGSGRLTSKRKVWFEKELAKHQLRQLKGI